MLAFADLWDQTSRTASAELLSLLPLRISHPYPSLSESGEHRRRIDPHPLTEPCQRPTLPIEPDGLVDLAEGKATPPHRHIVPMQDLAHRPPVNPELVAELVDSRTSLVTGDEFLDLLALKLPC